MKSIYRWIISIALISSAVFGIFYYKELLSSAKQNGYAGEPIMTVKATTTKAVDYQKTINVNGEVQAYKQLQLSNELAGKITTVNFTSGAAVKKNQLLLELDYTQEKAQLIAAKARISLNQKTLKRYKKLQKNNQISRDRVDEASANVLIAQSEVAVLNSIINKKKLTAPFAAYAGIHNLEVGQYLDSNTEITTLIGIHDRTWIDFYLPQTYPHLALETTVSITHIGYQKQTYEARIIAVNPQLSSQLRSLKYRAEIISSELSLKPGTFVQVTIPVEKAITAISVPDLAVTRDHLGEYIFLLAPEENGFYRAQRQKVTLGDRKDNQVLIHEGLQSGQLIATTGAFKLYSGSKVFIAEDKAENTISATAQAIN